MTIGQNNVLRPPNRYVLQCTKITKTKQSIPHCWNSSNIQSENRYSEHTYRPLMFLTWYEQFDKKDMVGFK